MQASELRLYSYKVTKVYRLKTLSEYRLWQVYRNDKLLASGEAMAEDNARAISESVIELQKKLDEVRI